MWVGVVFFNGLAKSAGIFVGRGGLAGTISDDSKAIATTACPWLLATIEPRLQLTEMAEPPTLNPAQLVALADALSAGTLNDNQRELVHALRAGLLALAKQEAEAENGVDPQAVFE